MTQDGVIVVPTQALTFTVGAFLLPKIGHTADGGFCQNNTANRPDHRPQTVRGHGMIPAELKWIAMGYSSDGRAPHC